VSDLRQREAPLKLSKFGAFIGCNNYPECRYTRPLTSPADGSGDIGTKKLGEDPVSGLEVTLRSGRFGPYVQLGEAVEGEKRSAPVCRKARRPRMSTSNVRSRCCRCRARSAVIRKTASRSRPASAGSDRYVQHGKTYANLETGDDIFHIGLNRAVTLIAEKVAKGPRFRVSVPIRDDRWAIIRPAAARSWRRRPLRTLRQPRRRQRHAARDKTPETITLEEAAALIDARADRGPPACPPAQGNGLRRARRGISSVHQKGRPTGRQAGAAG